MHQDVAVKYVKRLLEGGIKLKDQNLQLKAYNKIKEDAESLHHFFTSMVSGLRDVPFEISCQDELEIVCFAPVAESLKASNLQGSNEGWLKDVLINIAEVLKLQDLSSIQLHVVLMGNSFPDLR